MEQLKIVDLKRYIEEKEIELTKEIDIDKLNDEDRIHIEAYEKLIDEVGDLQKFWDFVMS